MGLELAPILNTGDNTNYQSNMQNQEVHKFNKIVSGIYVGEYQKQAWVFVGEMTQEPRTGAKERGERLPLTRSASQESTQSEKDFSKQYQVLS